MKLETWPGEPFPLGAHWDGKGTSFSVFSEVADHVDLCLFDEGGKEHRVRLPDRTAFCWHGYVPGIGPGQRYGFRAHGPWSPADGQRCNPSKLLLDPYARAISGDIAWGPAVLPYAIGSDGEAISDEDSAPHVPRSVVIDPRFDWGDDRPLRRPLHETVIYEMHVKGFSKRFPDIPEAVRGTYAGLAHPASIAYLTKLGVTAVELLPVHQFVHDSFLIDRGLRNYWGYNSIAFFAPHNEYASQREPGAEVREFKAMVKALHAAGIEVILDVVYNHTAEGNHLGPMLSFKGFDNATYYRTVENDRRHYMDYTGTGNTLNMRNPQTLQLAMDSLRYWATEMHVDGFRFDLGTILAREPGGFDTHNGFMKAVMQDPELQSVKLIAEPWDIGHGGYQVGNFPVLWSEWNGKYRDSVRDYWRSQEATMADFASRLTGSSDLYQDDGRKPWASINFITAHDGFTLNDLVSYNEKHNEANGEENRDGSDHNYSNNCGHEGPTDDPNILALRRQLRRNQFACLLLAQGTPLILGGDEIGNSQSGNNNAYCQDNEIGWIGWSNLGKHGEDFSDFIGHLTELRRRFGQIRCQRWLDGRRADGSYGVLWLTPAAEEMKESDWKFPEGRFLSYVLGPMEPGHAPIFVVLNAAPEEIAFKLPRMADYKNWQQVLNTADDKQTTASFVSAADTKAPPRSVLVFAGSA